MNRKHVRLLKKLREKRLIVESRAPDRHYIHMKQTMAFSVGPLLAILAGALGYHFGGLLVAGVVGIFAAAIVDVLQRQLIAEARKELAALQELARRRGIVVDAGE